jgi:DNA-binding winged helix-turn-helix (wHTH) protein
VRAQFGAFVLDSASRELLREGRSVAVSPKALDLLILLVDGRPRALTKGELHERLWPDTFVVDANLSNLVAELRAALEDNAREPRFIRTVHRHGYAFAAEVDDGTIAPPGEGLATCSLDWPGGRVALGQGDHLIGREAGVGARITDPSVSRHHARLRIVGSRATLEDLGSKNGTFVSDRPIASITPLADGDELLFGSFRVTFRMLRREPSTRTVVSRRS